MYTRVSPCTEGNNLKNRVTLLPCYPVKGHSKSLGNDAADELTKRGSGMFPAGAYLLLPLPVSQVRTWIHQRSIEFRKTRTASSKKWH
ncbi:unnamed protein product [Pieris macdunnoughi]|uniref:Uncharacterized protein n=1 Tax=Pieris macdunnoughi TaxID=345717 RepID=A0A821PMJ6_9NEOP|nr:unnamed protein product [Pieris macdunnoughi]